MVEEGEIILRLRAGTLISTFAGRYAAFCHIPSAGIVIHSLLGAAPAGPLAAILLCKNAWLERTLRDGTEAQARNAAR